MVSSRKPRRRPDPTTMNSRTRTRAPSTSRTRSSITSSRGALTINSSLIITSPGLTRRSGFDGTVAHLLAREAQPKDASFPHDALRRERAAMRGGDVTRDAEPEADAAVTLVGLEVADEDLREPFGRDARPGVAHRQVDELAVGIVGDL